MLVPDSSIVVESWWRGAGNGSHRRVRCDLLDFVRDMDGGEPHAFITDSRRQIEDLAFQRFRDGTYELQPPELNDRARDIIALDDRRLIERMFSDDSFEREIVRRELALRGIKADDLYSMGRFGDANARSLAIDLVMERTGVDRDVRADLESGEQSDAPTDRASRFGNGNSTPGPR